jgi:hypothetical protein
MKAICIVLFAIAFFAFGIRWIASDPNVPLVGRVLCHTATTVVSGLMIFAAYSTRKNDDEDEQA